MSLNVADELLTQAIRTKPWRELSLCGVSLIERTPKGASHPVLDLQLAWVEQGQVHDEYVERDVSTIDEDLVKEIVAFSRGSIPVAWGKQARALLHESISHEMLVELDPMFCFLLRRKSRWLDPSLWCRIRTGKLLSMGEVQDAVGAPRTASRAVDVATLAFALPMRPGFPVKPEWTASETADWQELQEAF